MVKDRNWGEVGVRMKKELVEGKYRAFCTHRRNFTLTDIHVHMKAH